MARLAIPGRKDKHSLAMCTKPFEQMAIALGDALESMKEPAYSRSE